MGQIQQILLVIIVLNNYFIVLKCDDEDLKLRKEKYEQAFKLANEITSIFYNMFEECISSTIQNKKYIQDNLHGYVNYPARTTVGYAPKFTSNRKFFANLLSTTEFKRMLENDEDAIRKGMIRKMKFCDLSVMDEQLLKDFYSKEVNNMKF